MNKNLREQLKAIDEELGRVPLPPGLQQRVLGSTSTPRTGAWVMLLATGAACLIAFFVGRRTSPNPSAPSVAEADVDVEVASPQKLAAAPVPTTQHAAPTRSGCPLASDVLGNTALTLPVGCTLNLSTPALTLYALEPARLARAQRGVRVLDGDVLFAVEKVAPHDSRVRVEVSAGTIEVLGTRFVVHHEDGVGHVDLLEGSIAFVAKQGKVHEVTPGTRLSWTADRVLDPEPRPPLALVSTRAPRGAKPKSSGGNFELEATLNKVAALRRSGDYRQAVTLLRNKRIEIQDPAISKTLSYEEGTLREHYESKSAACAFWRGHAHRFGAQSGASTRLRGLGCDTP